MRVLKLRKKYWVPVICKAMPLAVWETDKEESQAWKERLEFNLI